MSKRQGEWLETVKFVAEVVLAVATAIVTVNATFSDEDSRSRGRRR